MKSNWRIFLLFIAILLSGCEQEDVKVVSPSPSLAQPQAEVQEQSSQDGHSITEDEKMNEEQNEAMEEEDQYVDDPMPYDIDILADGLNVPWDMDIARDGRIFFTERPGTIRVIDADGKLLEDPLFSFDSSFYARSESGLLGIVLDPNFEENSYLYVYHTYRDKGTIQNRVLRLRVEGNTATIDRILINGLPGANNHNGGRIKIGPDGYLYITAGDRYEPSLAQDMDSLGGKILRIALDGSIPEDNPFPNSPIYSLGHRNAQGLAWHPATGQLYASEHGQTAHDEINLISAGANYGWPIIEGDETSSRRPELLPPILQSGKDTWAPSGMTFVTKGPWKGKLLVANLRGEQVLALTFNDANPAKIEQVEFLFQDWGRIRNVYEGPDGTLYIMTNNRDGRGKPGKDDDKIYRLTLRKASAR